MGELGRRRAPNGAEIMNPNQNSDVKPGTTTGGRRPRAKYFVTGTDTEVGKTTVSCLLLAVARAAGLGTLALKPVAAGCEQNAEGEWHNEDALALRAMMTAPLAYQQVNPVALPAPMAPHLAAQAVGRRLSVSRLAGLVNGALLSAPDFTLVEGAGGWLVPLNDRETFADLVKELKLPVILVVGMRLGCLNHALLTAEVIRASGVPLAGWVANCIEPDMPELEANIDTLRQWLPEPCLGVIPRLPACDSSTYTEHAHVIDLDALLAARV